MINTTVVQQGSIPVVKAEVGHLEGNSDGKLIVSINNEETVIPAVVFSEEESELLLEILEAMSDKLEK